MKAKPLFPLFLMFLLFVTGCSTPSREAASFTRLEEMEIYRVLDANIDEESSLEEMLDAFSRMIQVPMDVSTDMYLLEIHPYEFEEKSYLAYTIVRQFELPSHADLIEIGFTAGYLLTEDIADFQETKFFEGDPEGFLQYITEHEYYKVLLTKEIVSRNVGISSW